MLVVDFNITLSVLNRSSSLKRRLCFEYIISLIIDIQNFVLTEFFSNPQWTFAKLDHVLSHKENLNKMQKLVLL